MIEMDFFVKRSCYFLLFLPLLLCGCDATEHPFKDSVQKKEVLIYCGVTMLQPIMELSAIMEKEKDCIVKISYGGSGHLKNSVEVNRIGDLFFPGSISYLHALQKKGLITEIVDVGHMEIAFFVRKGNPKKVKADLRELLRPDLKVVIGMDNAGSVGKETRLVLQQQGIYEDVSRKALYMTTDSKGLVQALRKKDADVVLNWRAVAHNKDNSLYMDEIRLPTQQVEQNELAIGLLTCGRSPELAHFFLELAVSSTGREIFSRYGL